MEAYDDAVVQRGGKSTKESDLNLPENWPELFNNVQDNTEGEGGKSNVGKAESPPKKKPRRGRKSKHSEPQTDGDDSSAAKSPKEVKVTSEEDKDDDVKDNGKACPHCKKCFYSRNGFEYHIGELRWCVMPVYVMCEYMSSLLVMVKFPFVPFL